MGYYRMCAIVLAGVLEIEGNFSKRNYSGMLFRPICSAYCFDYVRKFEKSICYWDFLCPMKILNPNIKERQKTLGYKIILSCFCVIYMYYFFCAINNKRSIIFKK